MESELQKVNKVPDLECLRSVSVDNRHLLHDIFESLLGTKNIAITNKAHSSDQYNTPNKMLVVTQKQSQFS